MMERQGEVMSRDMKRTQTETLLGMSQQRTAAAAQAEAAAKQARMSAITGGLTGAASMMAGFGDAGNVTPGGIEGMTGAGTGTAPVPSIFNTTPITGGIGQYQNP